MNEVSFQGWKLEATKIIIIFLVAVLLILTTFQCFLIFVLFSPPHPSSKPAVISWLLHLCPRKDFWFVTREKKVQKNYLLKPKINPNKAGFENNNKKDKNSYYFFVMHWVHTWQATSAEDYQHVHSSARYRDIPDDLGLFHLKLCSFYRPWLQVEAHRTS